MKILWLTWEDRKHPLAGGAELVNEELAKRLAKAGHEVKFVVGGFAGASSSETRDGFHIVRLGNRFTVYWRAYRYYKKNLADWPDLVIDEMNTIPFFAKFYAKQRNIMFVHQLCREIWFYQITFPLSLIGYLLEPIYLWLLSDQKVVTVSESTKRDLIRFGFTPENIHIMSEGIEVEPLASLDFSLVSKYPDPTVLALGAIRPMKRTLDIIRAFEILKQSRPSAKLIVAGESAGSYGQRMVRAIGSSPFKKDITVLGRVAGGEKRELLQKAHVLAVASVKEGWGLVVTEANSQGTPAVVYDVDGLRDSVKNGETGIMCAKNTPENLAKNILKLLDDEALYAKLQHNAWKWSKEITFDKSYQDFKRILSLE